MSAYHRGISRCNIAPDETKQLVAVTLVSLKGLLGSSRRFYRRFRGGFAVRLIGKILIDRRVIISIYVMSGNLTEKYLTINDRYGKLEIKIKKFMLQRSIMIIYRKNNRFLNDFKTYSEIN